MTRDLHSTAAAAAGGRLDGGAYAHDRLDGPALVVPPARVDSYAIMAQYRRALWRGFGDELVEVPA